MGTPGTQDEEFVSEPITPEPGSFATELMARGLAALPAAFTWRNRRYEIVECLEHEKQSAPEGGREGAQRYLRRQVFVVRLDTGQRATLYIQRQAPRGSSPPSGRVPAAAKRRRMPPSGRVPAAAKRRWFLYSIQPQPPC